MRYLFIILLIWLTLLCFANEPDSTKVKLKKMITKQEKMTPFDSLMIKIEKQDSIKKAKK